MYTNVWYLTVVYEDCSISPFAFVTCIVNHVGTAGDQREEE